MQALPSSPLASKAIGLARLKSSDMLFNHLMRTFRFAEVFAAQEAVKIDREMLLLACVLHDLGLTDEVCGCGRFEVEGAHAARSFLLAEGAAEDLAWRVWDAVALHTLDLNLERRAEERCFQRGVLCDVIGAGAELIAPEQLEAILAEHPRLGFKQQFFDLLRADALSKPPIQTFHPSTMIRRHLEGDVAIPDARALIDGAPFGD